MAADCAVELRKHNVAHVSIWPGPVMTEHVDQVLKTSNNVNNIYIFYILIFFPSLSLSLSLSQKYVFFYRQSKYNYLKVQSLWNLLENV